MKPHIFSIAATLLGDCTGVLDWEIRIKFSCFAIFPSVRLSRWLRRCRACENGRSHRLSRTDRKIAKPLNLTRIFSVWTCSAITYLCWHSRGRHLIINLLHHANETQNGRNSCPRMQPYFIDFRRVCVSQSQFFYVVSALQTFFCIFLSQFQDNYHGIGSNSFLSTEPLVPLHQLGLVNEEQSCVQYPLWWNNCKSESLGLENFKENHLKCS